MNWGRHLSRGRVLATLLLVALVWATYVGYSASRAWASAQRGRDMLDAVNDQHGAEDLLRGLADGELSDARDELDDAASRLGGPAFLPIRWLPVIGRQTRSASSLAGAGRDVIDIALELSASTAPLMQRLDIDEIDAPGAISELAPVLDAAYRQALDIDLGPSEALLGPLADARVELADRHYDLVDGLGRVSQAAPGLAEFLAGPGRYLLFAANNAQMQSGQGQYLSVGVATIADGELSVSEIRSVSDLPFPDGSVALDADFEGRWGWLRPNETWSSLGLTPRFDATAPSAAAMWEDGGFGAVDGVIVVDPVALSAIVEAVGPVTADGQDFGHVALLEELLHGQYAVLGEDVYEDWREYVSVTRQRRDRLADIAAAVMSRITADDVDRLDVLLELAEAARGRHVLIWSADPEHQAAWRAAEVDGSLEADSMLLSLVNRSGTKGDFFVSARAEVEVEPGEKQTEVVVTVEVHNEMPLGEPRYVAGPHPALADGQYGDYLAVVSLNIPGAAVGGRIDGVDSLVVVGADGPTRVIGGWVRAERDTVETHTIRFALPSAVRHISIEPSARVPAVEWTFRGETFVDDAPFVISW